LCTNTLGNYQCSCPLGFTGNARDKCTDINECSQTFGPNGKCGYSAVCTNTIGSFSCRCPPGSNGDPFSRCVTEHICDANTGCTGNAVCKNGKCVCPAPYFGESCKREYNFLKMSFFYNLTNQNIQILAINYFVANTPNANWTQVGTHFVPVLKAILEKVIVFPVVLVCMKTCSLIHQILRIP